MEWDNLSTDSLEQRLAANRNTRSRLDAEDIEILEILDQRQVAMSDGSRSLSEWLAARMDIGLETSLTLVRTMRRTSERPDLREELAAGEITLDRMEALSRISESVGLLAHLDVAGVRADAAKRVRLTSDDEYRSVDDRFLVMQPSLDESWWRLWGGLDGPSGAIVDKVLTESADQLPAFPDGSRGSSAWRKATALVELATNDDPPPAQVTIFVDADQATLTAGEAGLRLEAGPKVGVKALEAILCDAITELSVRADDGRYMDYGHKSRTAPPALKRTLMDKHQNMCAADGCDSRYRLEAHHIIPWQHGGATDQTNMTLLCWFHHHVVIHERGFLILRHPQHGRIRFKPPDRSI